MECCALRISLSTDFGSQNLYPDFGKGLSWFNCKSASNLRQSLPNFMDARFESIDGMLVCALIPDSWKALRPLLKGWKRVLVLPRGSQVRFLTEAGTIDGPSKYGMSIWYLPPCFRSDQSRIKPVTTASDEEEREPTLAAFGSDLTMCFEAQIAGTSGHVLFDSGASENFVSAVFARLHGVSFVETPGTVKLGDKLVAEKLLFTLNLGPFINPSRAWFYQSYWTGLT
jgi:hypothetical protein